MPQTASIVAAEKREEGTRTVRMLVPSSAVQRGQNAASTSLNVAEGRITALAFSGSGR